MRKVKSLHNRGSGWKEEEQDLYFLKDDYPCPIFYIDIMYPTVEHAYQAQKIEIRKRGEERRAIGDLTTARQARMAGDKIVMSDHHKKWFLNNVNRIRKELWVAKFGQFEIMKLLMNIEEKDIIAALGYGIQSDTIILLKKAIELKKGRLNDHQRNKRTS